MDQPLFSCSKCLKNFPQSEMSKSGQTCKGCKPHHSTFKQCEYCKSDFKYHVYGTICPRCQSLKSKYGDPQPCSICHLSTAFGNALVCQRCLHYRMRFGEPRECQKCGQLCAFLKDEVSRRKVDGQILCWVCTYNFKLARSRERSEHNSKRRLETTNRLRSHGSYESHLKRVRSDDYGSLKTDSTGSTAVTAAIVNSAQSQGIDSVYNEHLLTISQLQDEIKALKRQLAAKDAELLTRDRQIAELRSEMIEMKTLHEDRLLKAKSTAQAEQDRLTSVIKQLQREKVNLSQSLRKRKSRTDLTTPSPGMRSASSTALFDPDSPIPVTYDRPKKMDKTPKPVPKPKVPPEDDDDAGIVMKCSTSNEQQPESTKKKPERFSDDPAGSLKVDDTPYSDKWDPERLGPLLKSSAKQLFGMDTSSDSEATSDKGDTVV